MQYFIKTLGCQMNHSDSERIAQVLEQCGFILAPSIAEADFCIINTCSVRQKSEDKAYGLMTQHRRDFPKSKIAVTGCMVRQTGDRDSSRDPLLQHDMIDLVFRIEDTARLPKLLESHFPQHDFTKFETAFGSGTIENYFKIVPKVENKAQVFVPIMQGCDKFCTYCIVPYTRGREISRPMDEVLSECETLVDRGAKEITLLGQNVNSYTDGGNAGAKRCFAELLLAIDALHEKGLSRIRFMSAHPQDFTDDVIMALRKMKTACPYVHLPVQHGADTMLRKMNRNYEIREYEDIIKRIRKSIPDCTIATDIIVGFPGETDSEFKELCAFAKRMAFDFSFTAIFSPRKNTPAARMKSEFIDMETKKKRFHIFDALIKKMAFKKRQQYVGKTLEILVESSEKQPDGLYRNTGRSREFFETWFVSGRSYQGRLVMVDITEASGYVLTGKVKEGDLRKGLKVV